MLRWPVICEVRFNAMEEDNDLQNRHKGLAMYRSTNELLVDFMEEDDGHVWA